MQIFTCQRLANDGVSTVSEILFGGRRICFALEPGPRSPAHPRIPAERYRMVLRTEGGIYDSYRKRFGPAFFVGIPHILVPAGIKGPERKWIQPHIGNTVDDTLGCPLTGTGYVAPNLSHGGHYEVSRSEDAFRILYPLIRDACRDGEACWDVKDEEGR